MASKSKTKKKIPARPKPAKAAKAVKSKAKPQKSSSKIHSAPKRTVRRRAAEKKVDLPVPATEPQGHIHEPTHHAEHLHALHTPHGEKHLEPPAPSDHIIHHLREKHLSHKKQILLRGIGIHLLSYALIAMTLAFFNVPSYVTIIILLVLMWGLLVMSYAFYYHK